MPDKSAQKKSLPITPVAKNAAALRVVHTVNGVQQDVTPAAPEPTAPKSEKIDKGVKS
jgi:hypothetical protein